MYIEITSRKEKKGEGDFTYEFHVVAKLRKLYNLSDEFFSISGNIIFANLSQVRKFVNNFNKTKKDVDKIKVSEINAAGLIDEIFHYVIRKYEAEKTPNLFKRAIVHIEDIIGKDKLEKIQLEFIELFPSVEVYRDKQLPVEYLASTTGDKSNKEIVLEEMLLLFLANRNDANKKFAELFSEDYFSDKQRFVEIINTLKTFFIREASVDDVAELNLIDYLSLPIRSNPNSLTEQLDFIVKNWSVDIKTKFLDKFFLIEDLLKEEIINNGSYESEPQTIVPQYKNNSDNFIDNIEIDKSLQNYENDINISYEEPERFTPDIAWMPNVILIAKNIYVWLNQLSKKYQKGIKRLDQIPDAELDELARRNINGLWLIGLWERSNASKKIKNLMGNNDAVASAYSLYDYRIANDIGGEEAYDSFNERAKRRGIRLASDMVPNHTGLDSNWVRNYPDYFVQVNEPPFNYTFNGADLSDDPNIEIKIDDGYWSNSDAAVVFRRIDKRYNDVRYIYHGNDGTNMPWNDTAQLDMLKHEVREAVIQKIFYVARRFSIIRFDAAMTLAKKHFQRLWYPQPGTGGDISSRTDFSMSRIKFDDLFPVEFWREVVDRINSEMPETLLLAEAFWLMEGYFVRTLGMHRVYNSAFMNMMMKEENEKYRELIYNTLEFEPKILKRYVNFMSNPDEETAIEQFGSGDKYFGVLTLMVTLPGLPMFAHGQIEGYTEKYGMEYQRAYYNETPNTWLVDRHQREIFPLTRRRHLFSEVENFWFYDFYDLNGNLNNNVFVYSNSFNNARTLILFNNKYDTAYGNFQMSTPKVVNIDEENKIIKNINIAEALHINGNLNFFYIFKDMVSNLEYIFKGSDLWQKGLYLELNGFERRVFTDIREVEDTNGNYYSLYTNLNGTGITSIDEAIEDRNSTALFSIFSQLFESKTLKQLLHEPPKGRKKESEFEPIPSMIDLFIKEFKKIDNLKITSTKFLEEITIKLQIIKKLNLSSMTKQRKENKNRTASEFLLLDNNKISVDDLRIILVWLLLSPIQSTNPSKNTSKIISNILRKPFAKTMFSSGKSEFEINKTIDLIKLLLNNYEDFVFYKKNKKTTSTKKIDKYNFSKILDDKEIHKYLEVNIYKGVEYFNKESFEELIKWLMNLFIIDRLVTENKTKKVFLHYRKTFVYLTELANEVQFQFVEFKSVLGLDNKNEVDAS